MSARAELTTTPPTPGGQGGRDGFDPLWSYRKSQPEMFGPVAADTTLTGAAVSREGGHVGRRQCHSARKLITS
jgi:hypothetical protein